MHRCRNWCRNWRGVCDKRCRVGHRPRNNINGVVDGLGGLLQAVALGMADTLAYLNPQGFGWLDAANASVLEGMGLGARAALDIHVHTGGGVARATELFASYPNLTFGAVNAETNSLVLRASCFVLLASCCVLRAA